MKALTIKATWAWAIMNAGKDIENRDWRTKFRGRIAIHSSLGLTKREYQSHMFDIYGILKAPYPDIVKYDDITRGAIIGTVEIVDCVDTSDSKWFSGKYGFVLRNPVKLEKPIPCKGRLSFWDLPDGLDL